MLYSVIENSKVINNQTAQVLYEFDKRDAVTYEYLFSPECDDELDFNDCFFVLGKDTYFILHYKMRDPFFIRRVVVHLHPDHVRVFVRDDATILLSNRGAIFYDQTNQGYDRYLVHAAWYFDGPSQPWIAAVLPNGDIELQGCIKKFIEK